MMSPPDEVKEICFYTKNIRFPIAVYICSEWEKTQLNYLDVKIHTVETIAKWCISHNISYQIIYFLNFKSFIKNPKRTLAYLKLMRNLKNYK